MNQKGGNEMKRYGWLFFSLVSLAAGGLAGFLSREGMRQAYPLWEKPALTPPAIVFPIVWTVLYVLMGIGMARVWQVGGVGRQRALAIWVLQLLVNMSWSIIFFRMQQIFAALICLGVLWVLIVVMIVVFDRLDRLAAVLQIPYLLWVSFAAYLNYAIWMLNR